LAMELSGIGSGTSAENHTRMAPANTTIKDT
jgi:hypothetical protein